jgi:all-trans-retinol 13,14-reductase
VPLPARTYDSIVLGSGLSGLTIACLLTTIFREKVLILERHTKPGGFTHTFRRGRFEWDTGLHYVGKMQAGQFPRVLMDFLTRGEVGWRRMADPFEQFHFPGFRFGQRAGKAEFRSDLLARFPGEAASLRRYFRAMRLAQLWIVLRFASQVLPRRLAWIPRIASVFFRG